MFSWYNKSHWYEEPLIPLRSIVQKCFCICYNGYHWKPQMLISGYIMSLVFMSPKGHSILFLWPLTNIWSLWPEAAFLLLWLKSAVRFCQLKQCFPTVAYPVSCILFLQTAERPLQDECQTPPSHSTGNVTILQEVRSNCLSWQEI